MGDTTSDQDTFVSIENYVCNTPQPIPLLADGGNSDLHQPSDGQLFLNEGVYLEGNPEEHLNSHDASVHQPSQPASQVEDRSAFMWNLYAPEAGDIIGDTDDCEDTLEVPGDLEDTPDPSDLCGEFNTSNMKMKSMARIHNPQSHSNNHGTSSRHEDGIRTPDNRQENFAEGLVGGQLRHSSGIAQNRGTNDHSRTETPFPPEGSTPEQTEEVFLNATEGIISYKLDNPFLTPTADASLSSTVVLYSSMGSLTNGERYFWNSVAEKPTTPEAHVLKRLVETVQFQRKQVQDLKAAEIQIASSTLQSERRRHSEVEHERSAAIATLMEQLSEEGEQRAVLEEENAQLRSVLADLQDQNDEVVNYFTQFDKDFTFSVGATNALRAVQENIEDALRRDQEKIEEKQEKLEETETLLYETEKLAEDRLRKLNDLESYNKRLEAELRSSKEGLHDSSSVRPSSQVAVREEQLVFEKDDLQHQLRELELEMEKLKSALRISRDEQNKVNEALLSMNVELEDSKRRLNTLRKQRDSAERKHRDLMQTAASDRDRFYKFQSEMSLNFANAVNEIEERQTQVRRLQNELEDRDKSFQSQTSVVAHLQEQLQAIIDAAVEDNRGKDEGKEDQGEKSVAATVVKSMREEVAKAQALLKERGEEIEGLRQQLYSKDELVASVQLECNKLRTSASVRKVTSRMSQLPSTRMEQHQSAFLRRLSEKLRCEPKGDGEVLKKLTERIDILSKEKGKFEDGKKTLVEEVKKREHAMHALRAEMAAEIATLKADVRHQETLRIRSQDDYKTLEKKYHEFLDTKKASGRESFGDVTSSSLGIREWALGEDSDRDSRRESMYSAMRDEDGVRWKDPIIEGAVRSLNALIGTKDELWARNRELKEKLENLLKNMGISDDEGRRLRSLIMQSKDFQDELTRIVHMQQGVLGNIAGSAIRGEQAVGADDTLPYLRGELSPERKEAGSSTSHPHTISTARRSASRISYLNEAGPALQNVRGEAAQFLREQLNETRALCNEKLKANVQLCGVISALKQEVKHLSASNSDLESALSAVKETHEEFVSRLALLTGTEQSAVAIEDCMRTVMHKVIELNKRFSGHKDRENSLTRRITCLVAQKHVLTHIIDIYQSKYKLDFVAAAPAKASSRQRLRKCVTSIIALGKMTHFTSFGSATPSNVLHGEIRYDVPPLAAIARYRTGMVSLHNAVIAVEAMPRLERALVEKSTEITKLQDSLKGLERSLAVATESARTVTHELPSSFLYKDDIMNRKNDMARRLRDMIQEKEDLDERLSREKQARIAAEARSTRYFDKVSILKKKLTKTLSNAESKERTYKAAIIYLKGKADKANATGVELDENIDPYPASSQIGGFADYKMMKGKPSHAESRAVLEQELANAEMELANLEVGSDAYEKKSQYIKGLYGGIQRLGKPMLSDHYVQSPVANNGTQSAR